MAEQLDPEAVAREHMDALRKGGDDPWAADSYVRAGMRAALEAACPIMCPACDTPVRYGEDGFGNKVWIHDEYGGSLHYCKAAEIRALLEQLDAEGE